MSARPTNRCRAWLGLLLLSLTPTAAAPITGVPVHWCVHELFSTLNHPAVLALRRGAGGNFPELP